jgi:hypothetical protein
VVPERLIPSNIPHILQFWTFSAFFTLVPIFKSETALDLNERTGLQRYSIADESGDWCGTILFLEQWAIDKIGMVFEFAAISEARDFSMEEHDTWTYYVSRDRVDSEWDIYYVLLLVKDSENISERIGLGKVYKDAFKKILESGSKWREFALR